MEKVHETLRLVLGSIVSYPDEIEIFSSVEKDDSGELEIINVKVHKDDVGLCIGVGGSTAEALRKIIGLVGFKQVNKRVYVRIDAPKLPKAHFTFDAQK